MPTEHDTYLDVASRKLAVICDSLHIDPERRRGVEQVIGTCLRSWADVPVGRSPSVLSDITDDHTPFEFSLTFRAGMTNLRFLVEPRPPTPKIDARWHAGIRLLERLQREYGIDLARFRQIEDIFHPTDQWARFAMWHAANLGTSAAFKVYVNPAARTGERASDVVDHALERLGFGGAWASVPALRPGLDEVKYFSLDLAEGPAARVKVYFSHRDVDADVLETMLSRGPGYQPGTAARFCRVLSNGRKCFDRLPVQTCYSFVGGNTPDDVAVHFPVRAYVDHDGDAVDRVSQLIAEPVRERYRQLMVAFVGDCPTTVQGVQTYASFWSRRPEDVTVYLSPKLFG
jgi:DMATS type aromatic prenyltransferase